jgi:alpha-glucoside transport system substrate-binding protein
MKYGKRVALVAVTAALVAGACGSSSKSSGSAATTAAGTATTAGGATTAAAAGDSILKGAIKCTQQYKGKTVHLFTPVRNNATDTTAIADFTAAYKPLMDCTGLNIVIDGTDQFETQIKVLVAGGNPPDVIDFPQPGLMASLAAKGQIKPLPDNVAKAVQADYIAGWDTYSTVAGKVYGVPTRANIKSLVWYSPADFKAKGYAIPTTLDELKTLSDKIAADGGTPWCAGIESGVATGWPVTDWFEDGMLRFNTPEDYDAWVAGTLKFSDPKVVKVADWVASYLKNPKYIAGGDNGIKAEATTKFQDGGLPILDKKCYMHRQASFYKDIWPKGTTIGPDGQVNFFYLPVSAGGKKVMLGAGDIYAAGTDKPESYDVLLYGGSSEYITALDKGGRTELSPRKDFDTAAISDPVAKSFGDLLKASEVFRFDGSDLMPGAVGSGTFWTEATKWITGEETTAQMLSNIDASWPK